MNRETRSPEQRTAIGHGDEHDEKLADSESFETRLPRKNDRLFLKSTWAHDANIIRDSNERFYRMPMGYKRAGDILVDQAMVNRVDRQNIIYAALFCYRLAIELYLKGLIEDFGSSETRRLKPTHNLIHLWEGLKDITIERGKGDWDVLNPAELLIREMQEADQRSDGFRFPTDTKGSPFEFGDRGIDLPNLRVAMQGLVNFFECLSLEFFHGAEAPPL